MKEVKFQIFNSNSLFRKMIQRKIIINIMMNIIVFVKEFDFIKGRRLRSQGGANTYMLREVRKLRGARRPLRSLGGAAGPWRPP